MSTKRELAVAYGRLVGVLKPRSGPVLEGNDREITKAILGAFLGNTLIVEVPNDPSRYYVRFVKGGYTTVLHKNRVGPQAGLAVDLIKLDLNNYEIKDPSEGREQGQSIAYPRGTNPSESYTPAVPGDWPMAPTSKSNALDILADQLTGGTDADAFHDNVAGEINALTSKTTPQAFDQFLIEDSGNSYAKRKLAWGDILEFIEDVFDTFLSAGVALKKTYTDVSNVYQMDLDITELAEDTTPDVSNDFVVTYDASANAHKKVKPSNMGIGADAAAIHDNVASEIHAITEKTTPVDDDELVIEDSADSYNKKRLKISNLPSGSPSGWHAEVIHDETLAADGHFDVTSIASGYRRLEFFSRLRSNKSASATDTIAIYCNGDTTASNYRWEISLAQNGSALASASSDPYVLTNVLAATGYGDYTEVRGWIMDYDDGSTEKYIHLEWSTRSADTTTRHYSGYLVWSSTDPIDQITIEPTTYATAKLATGNSLLILGWGT